MTDRMKVLLLHAYSAANGGDALLAHEAIRLAEEYAGGEADITMAASDPASFADWGVRVVNSRPGLRGWDQEYRQVLASIDDFQLVIGVGGGYLRFGRPIEALKTALVHGPQLSAAARACHKTQYLPQSIGPLRFASRRWVGAALGRVGQVYVRDDRSLLDAPGSLRSVDMGLMVEAWTPSRPEVDPVPVLSVRTVGSALPRPVQDLARRLHSYDGYVQSSVRSNDDRAVTASLGPRHILSADDLLSPASPGRVVVAMRLHAAIQALAAGHYVIHLAYERKGWGAYTDMGLRLWVHPARSLDPRQVGEQVAALVHDPAVRQDYAAKVRAGRRHALDQRARLVEVMRGG